MKSPREYKIRFTYDDIAKIKHINEISVVEAARHGTFDPRDLASVTRYVYADVIRDLKQTLKFWKKKAKGER